MSRNDSKLPWRVIAISVVLFALVGFAAWMIFGPIAAPGSTTEADAAEAPAPAASPTVATVDPTPGALPAAEPAPQIDPTSSEALAPLARQRAERGTMDLQLFLIVPGLERLIPVPRTIFAPATIDAQAQQAVEELIGWAGTETLSPLPPQAAVREVWVSPGGIAYVDFDQAFYDFSGGGSLGELHTVYSVVATLAVSFPEISAVQILIEGAAVDTLAGHVDLSRPLLPSDEWCLLEPGLAPQQDPDEG